MDKVYACIDLKSFYASVEAVERGLDPSKVNLIVSDKTRGDRAITLAITPAMKKLGIKNRCRLYEIPKNVEYIIAKPRMKLYMKYSADIYSIYLKYIAPEDIHVYSIDECFLDLTNYLSMYKKSPYEICKMIMNAVYIEKGIQSTVGIGTNLFLAKVALDLIAKSSKDYIGYLDNKLFDEKILKHKPITDIWGIGKGIAKRLSEYGIYDLEGIKKAPKNLMFKLFGVNGEILIDHANGYELCTMEDIHSYIPKSHGVSISQILFEDYNYKDAWLVITEMIETLTLEIINSSLKTNSINLKIGYSRDIIKSTTSSRKLKTSTNSFNELKIEFRKLFDSVINKYYPIRKLAISLNDLYKEEVIQLDFLGENENREKELKLQQVMIDIKKKYGKNSILRGISLEDKSTMKERNKLVGGHYGGDEEEY